MTADEITLAMTTKDWKIFRRALKDYTPTKSEEQTYNDLYTWICTDWDD